MVSTSVTRSVKRLSTISIEGNTKSVARITSAAFTDGPRSASRITNAISISTSGRNRLSAAMTLPSGTNQWSNSVPKSGSFACDISRMAFDVRPTLWPFTMRPAARRCSLTFVAIA